MSLKGGDAEELSIEQKREDVFEEIIYKSDRTNLTHLRRMGWNGISERFRAPSWQLLLQYLPVAKSKRKWTIRRKRNEYHRHITKFYFEFDFCLTDRPLPMQEQQRGKEKEPKNGASAINERIRKKQFPDHAVFLFSQDDDSFCQPDKKSALKREDALLLQIRYDINTMVDIPISSQQETKRLVKAPADLETITSTTTNRSFANPRVKASVERILYLWSVRWKGRNNSSTTCIRYVPGMTDIVYPIFLTFLQGYVWETHSSTFKKDGNSDEGKYNVPTEAKEKNATLHKMLKKLENDPHFDVKGFLKDTNAELSGSDCEAFGDEERHLKITRCSELSFGKGLDLIPDEVFDEIEADTYWCLENLMAAIQDYRYDNAFSTSMAPDNVPSNAKGIQSMIVLMDEILNRVDPTLHSHLKSNGVESLWFAFRWMNSLLVRDMNDKCISRLWDTYLCEEIDVAANDTNYYSTFGFDEKRVRKQLHLSGFHSFQVYVCAALLHHFRESILSKIKLLDILKELQNPPLDSWDVEDVSRLLSQAYAWKETFRGSERQLLLQATPQYGSNTLSNYIEKCHWPPRTKDP